MTGVQTCALPISVALDLDAGNTVELRVTKGTLEQFLQSGDIGSTVQAYDANLTVWTSKTPPSGTIVGTTDAQVLTSKTLTNPVINGFSGNTAVINVGSGQIYKDTSGNVAIGTTSTATIAGSPAILKTASNPNIDVQLAIHAYGNNAWSPKLFFTKTRATTPEGFSPIYSGDGLGDLEFGGVADSTSAYGICGLIGYIASENWTSSSTPGHLRLCTTDSGYTTEIGRAHV